MCCNEIYLKTKRKKEADCGSGHSLQTPGLGLMNCIVKFLIILLLKNETMMLTIGSWFNVLPFIKY